jgi:ABC-2 type transport system permease protein
MNAKGSGLYVVYSYYLKNYYRSKSFYLIMILIVLITALMIYLSIHYLPKIQDILPTTSPIPSSLSEKIMLYLWAYVMSDIPVFAAVFFSSPAISSEIENRTAFHIFTIPIGRSTLLLGKYLAAVSATIISLLIYIVSEAAITEYLFGNILLPQFLISVGMIVIFVSAMSAFTFLISSLFNKNLYSYITTFVLYFVVFSSLNLILLLLYNYNAFFLLSNSASIIERIFINISPGVFNTHVSLVGASTSSIVQAMAVMVIYTVVSLIISLIIFERKEVK